MDQTLEIGGVPGRRLRLCGRADRRHLFGGDLGRRITPAGALVADDRRDLGVGQLVAEGRHRVVELGVLDRDVTLDAVEHYADRHFRVVEQPFGAGQRRIRAGNAESGRLVTGSASSEQLSAVGRRCCTAGRDGSPGNDGLGRVEVHDAGRLVGGDRGAVRVAAVSTATGGESDKRGAGREGRESTDASGGHRLKISRSLLSDQVGEGDLDVTGCGAGGRIAVAAIGKAREVAVARDREGAVEGAGAWGWDDQGKVGTEVGGLAGETACVQLLPCRRVGQGERAAEGLAELGGGHGEADDWRRGQRVGREVQAALERCGAGVRGVVERLVETGDRLAGAGG